MAIVDELQHALAIVDRRARAHATLALIADAMAGLGFTKATGDVVQREIVSAASLDSTQRAGLLALATYPKLSLASYPVPSTAWAIRQWLGADPPGPLFAPDALYDALRAALRRSEQQALAMLLALPMPRRLHVLADLHLLPHDYAFAQVSYLLGSPHEAAPDPDPGCGRILAEIGADCGAWADAIAIRILEIEDAPALYAQQGGGRETFSLYLPVLLAMARAGRIEPLYTRFLGDTFDPWRDPRLVHECIAAIPDAHRQAAIDAAVDKLRNTVFVQDQILPRYPSAAVAHFVLANLSNMPKPKAALRTLTAQAKMDPAIAKELEAFEVEVAKRPTKPTKSKRRSTKKRR